MIDPGTSDQIIQPDPLVSVVITCYNQGKFLEKSIATALNQTYPYVEIILIDDGSTDNTSLIAQSYSAVDYYFQENSGLSAARNAGIKKSKGTYILFLDADDWLYPEGIEANVQVLKSNEDAAFISGAFQWIILQGNKGISHPIEITDPYHSLLQHNYIGMHGTVLYRRSIFNEFNFDTNVKAFEDYDMYLQISKKYRVLHHNKFIAVYRKHRENMSHNNNMMLDELQKVLLKHKPEKKNQEAYVSWEKGKAYWAKYFIMKLIHESDHTHLTRAYYKIILENTGTASLIFIRHFVTRLKSIIRKIIPPFILDQAKKISSDKKPIPNPGFVRPGDFNRLTPFDNNFGFNRGGPIDRVYIERFLQSASGSIRGRVLEIGDNDYTIRFGGEKIIQSDILHVDPHHPTASFTGDLSNAPQLPDKAFDCIILTQTLHLIYDFKNALQTCKRILKPGGVLLLTVPGISPIDKGEWGDSWYWSFTRQSIQKLADEIFTSDFADIHAYGNVYAATAFLYGMGAAELTEQQLSFQDEQFPIIITLKVGIK